MKISKFMPLALVFIVLYSNSVLAQDSSAQNSGSQNSSPDPQNLFYIRGGGSSPFYGIYTHVFGKFTATTGVIVTPKDNYQEFLLGAGLNLTNKSKTAGIYPSVLFSKASDSPYVELWALPWIDKNKVASSAFLVLYLPASHNGVPQFLVDPASVFYKLHKRLNLGGSYTLTKIEGIPSKQAVGPALQIPFSKGSVGFDFLKGVHNYKSEVRLTLQLAF